MKQAVTELCGGMGAEISEQDSEKLRKDAFHPGRETSIERTAQDAKKPYLLLMQTGENSPPRTQTGAVVCEGDLQGADVLLQQVLHWWPWPHPLPCLSHHHLFLSPQPPSSGLAHRIGMPQEKALTFTKWLQVLMQDQHQQWGVRAVSDHHLSLSCLYCPFLQVFAISHLLWGQQGSPPRLPELESWTFPAGGISTPQHQALAAVAPSLGDGSWCPVEETAAQDPWSKD